MPGTHIAHLEILNNVQTVTAAGFRLRRRQVSAIGIKPEPVITDNRGWCEARLWHMYTVRLARK
jgi:hypothetical protein